MRTPRLQRLRGAVPSNMTGFGRSVARSAHGLVDEVLAALDCGFQDGGCFAFAAGVRDWSRGELVLRAFRDPCRPHVVQHATACHRGLLFLDSDGVGTARDVVLKLEAFERGRAFYACPLPFPVDHGLAVDTGLSALVARALKRDVGAYSPGLLPGLLGGPSSPGKSPYGRSEGTGTPEDVEPPSRGP